MNDDTKKNILKVLVALAWADGRVDAEETEVLEVILDSYGVRTEIADEIRQWAQKPRSLDDVDVSSLTPADAELILNQAVLVTYVDGEQSSKEVDLLQQLVAKLGLPKDEAEQILEQSGRRARDLLPILNA